MRKINGGVHIGNSKGRIAIWCDESEAWDEFYRLHSDDLFRAEIAKAIEEAYPEKQDEGDSF